MQLISDLIGDRGFDCLEAEWLPHERILRVYLDHPEGMNLERCEQAHRAIMDVQQLDDMVSGTYHLEISSPGLDRPLRRKKDFEQYIGRQVEVRINERNHRIKEAGKLLGVSADQLITILTETGEKAYPIPKIEKATVVHNWEES